MEISYIGKIKLKLFCLRHAEYMERYSVLAGDQIDSNEAVQNQISILNDILEVPQDMYQVTCHCVSSFLTCHPPFPSKWWPFKKKI